MRRDDAAAPPRKCLPPYNSTVRREVKRSPASGGPWKMAEKKGERNGKRPCFLPDSMYNNPQQIKHPLFFKKTSPHGPRSHAVWGPTPHLQAVCQAGFPLVRGGAEPRAAPLLRGHPAWSSIWPDFSPGAPPPELSSPLSGRTLSKTCSFLTWGVTVSVHGEGAVLPSKTLLAFALLHFVLQGEIYLLPQVFLDFLLLHSNPLW